MLFWSLFTPHWLLWSEPVETNQNAVTWQHPHHSLAMAYLLNCFSIGQDCAGKSQHKRKSQQTIRRQHNTTMERRLRGLVLSLAIIYYIVCIHHNMQTIQFYNGARMRLENNVLMHYKRRARIARHFKQRRALILLGSDILFLQKYYQRSIR